MIVHFQQADSVSLKLAMTMEFNFECVRACRDYLN